MSIQRLLARGSLALVTGSIVASLAAPVMAQEVLGLEEVVVTARKREENLQDVSMSITAISAADIDKFGIRDIDDISRLDASLIYDKGYSATDNRISIRGLSPTGGRVNVAVLIDGIDTSTESIGFGGGSLLATNRLLDLQAVEVVKGPQSALYGRAAFAGAVQYVTKDPSREPEASVRGEFGDFGRYELGTTLSGPVSETLGLRFNGLYWNQDGIYRNQVTGNKVGDGDGWGAALTAKWTPTDDFDAKLRLEFTDDQFGQFPTAQLPVNTVGVRPVSGSTCLTATGSAVAAVMGACPSGSGRVYSPTSTAGVFPGSNHVYSWRGTIPGADDLPIRLDPNPTTGRDYAGSTREIARATLVMNWNFASGTLTSLTGFTDAAFSFDEDGDFDSGVGANGVDRALRAARFDYDNDTQQLSQELRFRSDFDGPFNFMVGGLYWNDDAKQIARSINIFCLTQVPANSFFPGQPPIPPSCGTQGPNQVLGQLTAIPRLNGREVEHTSVFGLVEYQFNDTWKLTLEGRYADETETILGVNCSPALDAPAFPGGPVAKCQDPTFPGFAVFGPSINYLYPFFNPFAPMAPALGARQAPDVPVRLQTTASYFTPRVTLEAKPTEDTLVYLSWARGVKPGGISATTAGSWQDADYDGAYDEFSFKQETIQQYEIGAKTTFADGRLRLNPAVFFTKYDDKQTGAQLITPSGIAVGRLLNAGKAEVRGLELDAQWAPNDNWLFALNYAYLDAEFTDFPFTSTSATDANRFGDCPRGPDPRLCYINLKGKKLERAPEHSVVAQARWSTAIADLFGSGNARFFIEGDVQAQSSRTVDIWNTSDLDSYVLGNLRFGVSSERWDALVYVNNVADNDAVLTGNSNPGDVAQSILDPSNFSPADTIGATLPDPRIVGVRFNYRFAGN
jgi:outer membrane receptor protein involved in Fe transport